MTSSYLKYPENYIYCLNNSETNYMQVHVIRAEGFPQEQYDQVLQELNNVRGLINFHKQKIQVFPAILAATPVVAEEILVEDDTILYGLADSRQHAWSYFFDQCQVYRDEMKLAADEFVILLTPERNSMQWLAAAEDKNRYNVFIKTSEWADYLDCSQVFPITYVVMSQVLQGLFYDSMYERSVFGHQEAEGCMNDFCTDKNDVIFKLRTADICSACMEDMLEHGIKEEYLIQAFALFENVRREMLFRQRHRFKLAQKAVQITRSIGGRRGITIKVTEIGKEIELNPKESALYLLYLTQPDGVPYSRLEYSENREKLENLYRNFYEGAENNRETSIKKTIDTLVSNKARRDSDLSRMRNKFRNVLGDEAAKDYYINGLESERDTNKGIRLSRDLITYDYTIEQHILNN
jgi:hypothetical protein